jgi:hydroxypyruvate isomerase
LRDILNIVVYCEFIPRSLRCLPPAAGEGNLTETILANLGRIEHFEIADCPGRHQPGAGEINYRFMLDAIDRAGFDGWVCPEYVPFGGTEASLGWLRDWGYWA